MIDKFHNKIKFQNIMEYFMTNTALTSNVTALQETDI